MARSDSLTLDIAPDDRRQWRSLLAKAPRSSVQQSWAYGSAVELLGRQVDRYVLRRNGVEVALAQVARRRIGPVWFALLLRGPCWLVEPSDEDAVAALRVLRRQYRWTRGRFLLIQPERISSAETDTLLRRVRMRPVMTGAGTAWIDLTPDEATLRAALHQKWRNALKAGEASPPRVEIGPAGRHIDWFLDRVDEARQRSDYWGASGNFVRAMLQAGLRREEAVTAFAFRGGKPMAGMLFLVHGASATYYMGWAGPDGRDANAHNLLLWRGMLALRQRGITALDLGGINTEDSPGIARFKLGAGGVPVQLAGTYL